MVNTSCIAGCLDDVVNPKEGRRYRSRCKWAESDKEFLVRMLDTNRKEASSSSSSSANPVKRKEFSNVHERYASSRQIYLRSYTFTTKKQSATQTTKNWLKEKKTHLKAKTLKARSRCFMDACLKVLLHRG